METKRLAVAIIVSFVILFAAGYVIHVTWLGPTYKAMLDDGFSFRPPEAFMRKFWLIPVSDLLYAALFSWIYIRGREDKPWVSQGIRYGIIMTLFTVVPQFLEQYVTYNLPHRLVVHWMVGGLIVLVIMGLAVAGICKKPTTA